MTAPNNGKPLPENDPDAVGLYVPLHYYEQGDDQNPGNTPARQSGHATLAYALLRQLNESTRVVVSGHPHPLCSISIPLTERLGVWSSAVTNPCRLLRN
jgi:hypothetical protein